MRMGVRIRIRVRVRVRGKVRFSSYVVRICVAWVELCCGVLFFIFCSVVRCGVCCWYAVCWVVLCCIELVCYVVLCCNKLIVCYLAPYRLVSSRLVLCCLLSRLELCCVVVCGVVLHCLLLGCVVLCCVALSFVVFGFLKSTQSRQTEQNIFKQCYSLAHSWMRNLRHITTLWGGSQV